MHILGHLQPGPSTGNRLPRILKARRHSKTFKESWSLQNDRRCCKTGKSGRFFRRRQISGKILRCFLQENVLAGILHLFPGALGNLDFTILQKCRQSSHQSTIYARIHMKSTIRFNHNRVAINFLSN